MLGNLNHVAIAVPDLDAAIRQYQDIMGVFVSSPTDLPDHGVRVAVAKIPNTTIELITPLGNDSPIKGFLDKNPSGGIHHLCYEVNNIEKARDQLIAAGLQVVGDGTPKTGYHGNPVIFFNPKGTLGALIELEEVASKIESRIEIERIGPAHTVSPAVDSDSMRGYDAVGIGMEVDFKVGTPKDNKEQE